RLWRVPRALKAFGDQWLTAAAGLAASSRLRAAGLGPGLLAGQGLAAIALILNSLFIFSACKVRYQKWKLDFRRTDDSMVSMVFQ
ncbi:MAG: hypothetical protein ACM3SP_02155, partial [Chloroflexota bacterium]